MRWNDSFTPLLISSSGYSNISKIIRDSGIKLSWKILPHDITIETDLLRLVSKRMDEVANKTDSFCQIWDEIFPAEIDGKPSFYFIGAMNDELTGFFPDEAVTQLTSVLANVGGENLT